MKERHALPDMIQFPSILPLDKSAQDRAAEFVMKAALDSCADASEGFQGLLSTLFWPVASKQACSLFKHDSLRGGETLLDLVSTKKERKKEDLLWYE